MVSDNRGRTEFRVCPTVDAEGSQAPLVQQNITAATCYSRQERVYHKCHKCALHELARINTRLVPIPMI